MIHMILSDFDGTLVPKGDSGLSELFINKIKSLTDRGTVFAVNSGRPYSVLREMLKAIENRIVFICNDGAQIMYKNCVLYKREIGTETARTLLAAANADGFITFASLRDAVAPVSEETLSAKGLFNQDIFKIICIKDGRTNQQIASLRQLAEQKGLRVCYEDETYLELCRQEADKGAAAQYLKSRFGIYEGIAAFGDGNNDLVMFNEADRVFIMKDGDKMSYPGAQIVENMQDYVVQNF